MQNFPDRFAGPQNKFGRKRRNRAAFRSLSSALRNGPSSPATAAIPSKLVLA